MKLQADVAREREDKAAVKEASTKAVAAAKQHAADMSRDLEAVHDELEVMLLIASRARPIHQLSIAREKCQRVFYSAGH